MQFSDWKMRQRMVSPKYATRRADMPDVF
ncbi:DUF4113 domain-containing protein [Kiloniella litopenaei]